MEPDIAGVLRQIKSIQKLANELYLNPIYQVVKGLVEEYTDARINFESIRRKQNITLSLKYIGFQEDFPDQKALLKMILSCAMFGLLCLANYVRMRKLFI